MRSSRGIEGYVRRGFRSIGRGFAGIGEGFSNIMFPQSRGLRRDIEYVIVRKDYLGSRRRPEHKTIAITRLVMMGYTTFEAQNIVDRWEEEAQRYDR